MKNNINDKFESILLSLNKKGYYNELSFTAKPSSSIVIERLINLLVENKFLVINDDNQNQIKKIIEDSFLGGTTVIIFKENYKFDNLPEGFRLISGNSIYHLTYPIDCLKNNEKLEFKSALEFENEVDDSLNILEKWVENLPDISK